MMNEQEMQFADPDWKPTGPLPLPQGQVAVHTSPPAAPGDPYNAPAFTGQSASEQGYQEAWQAPRPLVQQVPSQSGVARGRHSSRWWVWVLAVVLFFVLLGGIGMSSYMMKAPASFTTGAVPVQQNKMAYSLRGATELDINDLSGHVVVNATNDGSQDVVVFSDPDAAPTVSYQGQHMVLTSGDDVTIMVPQNVALQLSGGLNDFEVNNFTGVLTAQTDSGSITLTNDTLSRGSSLNTTSGNIDQEQGSADNTSMTSSTGTITLNQVDLSGQITVSTGGNGVISYTGGTLDPQGKYQFTTESGSIDLALPADTAMHMTVSQKGGQFSSDFPPSTGHTPQAEIDITTNSGDITISKQ